MRNIGWAFLAVVLLVACNSNSEKGGDSELLAKQAEVKKIHDDAMELMMPLQFCEEAFVPVVEKAKTDESALKGHSLKEVEGVLEQVERNYQAMKNWMKNTKALGDLAEIEMDDERKMKYLESELQTMTKINDDSKNAITAAKELAKDMGIEIHGLEDAHNHDGHDHGDEGHDGHEH